MLVEHFHPPLVPETTEQTFQPLIWSPRSWFLLFSSGSSSWRMEKFNLNTCSSQIAVAAAGDVQAGPSYCPRRGCGGGAVLGFQWSYMTETYWAGLIIHSAKEAKAGFSQCARQNTSHFIPVWRKRKYTSWCCVQEKHLRIDEISLWTMNDTSHFIIKEKCCTHLRGKVIAIIYYLYWQNTITLVHRGPNHPTSPWMQLSINYQSYPHDGRPPSVH